MKRALTLLLLFSASAIAKPVLRVGSKAFTESYILAEIVAQTIEDAGEADVERHFGLGQTGIAFEALRNGKIDLYPEYSGTISEVMLKTPKLQSLEEIDAGLKAQRLVMSRSLGFNNTYAIGVRGELARRLNLRKVSDLIAHPELRAGLSVEFLKREDGFPRLQARYGLELPNLQGLAHSLAYEAIAKAETDLTDVYSTDAKIAKLGLVLLEDDLRAFPDYLAVLLAREDIVEKFPESWRALRALEGRLTQPEMVRLNVQAELGKKTFADIAASFRGRAERGLGEGGLWVHTREHLALVLGSLLAAILVALPLSIIASRSARLGQVILIVSGLIQTIPSLALLCFLIPVFGIGTKPALVALFLYGLLPIVRSSYVGLVGIDPRLREVARALALSPCQRLFLVELPLASPSILAGIKTSAIINVGTATLAALIGAGGYGVPIVTGLALNDIPTILQGAVPAAVLALVMHGLFEALDRLLIPRGLRL